MTPKHLDLFAGIGGFTLASEWNGIETIGFAENGADPAEVLKVRWPNKTNFGDVTKLARRAADCEPEDDSGECYCPRCDDTFGDCACIGTDQFLDEYGQPDIITAGFPCQDISNGGTTHAGGLRGLEGSRSGLWFEADRIICELSPAVCLLENVPALRVRGGDRVCSDLERAGFAVWPFLVPAWAAGGQITRNRAFVIAISLAECEGLERSIGEIVEDPGAWRQDAHAARPDWGHATPRLRGCLDGISRSVGELAGWKGQLQAYGNSVVPQVAAIIVSILKRAILDTKQT